MRSKPGIERPPTSIFRVRVCRTSKCQEVGFIEVEAEDEEEALQAAEMQSPPHFLTDDHQEELHYEVVRQD